MLFKTKKKPKEVNVRKIVFSLCRYDDTMLIVEVVGRVSKGRNPIPPIPKDIVESWGRSGFIRIDRRTYINKDQIREITFKNIDYYVEV